MVWEKTYYNLLTSIIQKFPAQRKSKSFPARRPICKRIEADLGGPAVKYRQKNICIRTVRRRIATLDPVLIKESEGHDAIGDMVCKEAMIVGNSGKPIRSMKQGRIIDPPHSASGWIEKQNPTR